MDEPAKLRPLSDSQRAALEEALISYEAALTVEHAKVLVARGIDGATARTFRLGVVGVDAHPGHYGLQGFHVIPYLDKHGKPLQLRFTCPIKHDHRTFGHGKYMTLSGDPARVFNIGAIHRAEDEIHVTEGEYDAMILSKLGLHAVAVPGASNWSGRHRRMLAGFNRIYAWGDPDDAGAEFNRKVTQSLRRATAVRLRVGDVTDTFRAGGADAVFALIPRSDEDFPTWD